MNWHFWLELLVRSAVLLAAGEAVYRLSQRQRPALRHGLVLWVFVLLGLVPLFSAGLPEIYIPLWRSAHAQGAFVTAQEVSSRAVEARVPHPIDWLFVAWFLGAFAASARLMAGAVAVVRMARKARPAGPMVRLALEKLRCKAEVRLSSELPVPLTCGLFRPRVLLPVGAEAWKSSQLEAVLVHELAHVKRRDVAAQVAAHAVAALWWFQPLVWIMRRRLRAHSEFACDAEAVRFGFRPSEYATELMAVAKAMGGEIKTPSLAISMVQSCELEDRVRAILSPPAVLASPFKMFALACALGSVAVAASAVTMGSDQILNVEGGSTMKRTILAALLGSAGLSAATITGSVLDSNGGAIPDVKVLLSNPDTGAKQETVTGTDGRFSLEGDGAGQYILRLEKPGLVSILREFDVKGDTKMDREFTMTPEGSEQVADKVVSTTEEQPREVRIGGRVAEANLTTKVQPIYPVAAKAARVQGTVEIEATISKDGVPVELRVLSSPSDDLSQSAIEAVRQWRYRPTLLNGQPIEIVTDVIVNYTLSH